MTTIVYDHKRKQIACDSRETAGSFICSDSVVKYIKLNDGIWFNSGSASDGKIYAKNAVHNTKSPENTDCVSLKVSGGKVYLVAADGDGIYKIQEMEMSEGLGSGGRFALSALDFGKTAKEAVEYAMTRDVYTGGKVHIYDIELGDFI